MPKPLRIFVPAGPGYSPWTRIHDWGAPTVDGGIEDHLRLETPSATPVLAACDGVLSIIPNSIPLVGAPFVQPWILPLVLPSTVSLFLNQRPGALPRTNLAGFLYRDLETSSLAPALGATLDSVVIGTSPTTRDQVVRYLIAGMAHVPVTAGQPIALPAPRGTGSTRQFGLAAIKSLGIGTSDPLGTFDDLRDEVEDGQPQVDLLLQAFPRPTDLFDPGLSEAAAIARTATRLYPWSTLQRLAARYGLSQASSQWRTIGNNQKALYLARLRVRVGHGGTSTAPPFEFNDTDLHNVFQLEAIVEFYANFHDPWKPGATPVSPSTPPLFGAAARSVGNWVSLDGGHSLASLVPNHDKIYLPASSHPSATYRIIEVDAAGRRVRTEGRPALPPAPAASPWRIAPYQEVNLLDAGGIAAAGVLNAPGVLQLDLDADLTRVWPNESPVSVDEPRDTIYLEQDQGRPSKLYKIIGVDHQQKRVTVDAPPVLNTSGRWRINHRPYLVMVDPFGARLQGEGATTQPAAPDRVLLPGANLARVNANFDTIYLASDTARPGRTYRILEVNDAADWVRIAHDVGNPVPSLGSGSRWYLQSGVGGLPAQVNYNLTSGRGFDHYDGMVFLVHGGAIHDVAPWTSYTSRNYSNYAEFRTSLRGNKDYEYSSYWSGESFKNYSLKVVDYGAGKRPGIAELFDGVREARWYYESVTRDDTELPSRTVGASDLGKTTIRFHYGVLAGTASGSAGCMVSPRFDAMRGSMVRRHNDERRAYDGTFDQGVDQLIAMDHGAAVALYSRRSLSPGDWTSRLVGWVWVIRPGERPL